MRQVGPVTLVLAHMGGWRDWPDVERLLPQTSVCLDTAFSLGKITPLAGDGAPPENLALLDSLSFMRMVRAFGAERILFATDSPWSDQQQALAAIRALPLTPQEQAAILSKNGLQAAEAAAGAVRFPLNLYPRQQAPVSRAFGWRLLQHGKLAPRGASPQSRSAR